MNLFKEYSRRLAVCILGLALFGFGNMLGVKAGLAGTNAWNTLALGLSESLGFSFGTGTLLISLLIIAIDLLGRGKLGLGTVLNLLLIPFFSDLFLAIPGFLPEAGGMIAGALYTLAGQMVLSFATIFYMSPALGCGPRDTLMILIGKKFPKAPIGTVKFCMELCALALGVLLGAPFGLGTILVMLLQAAIFQLVCRVLHYEPRSVSHEDLPDTLRRLFPRLSK